jgi:ABC-2 type transport system ATP-binding protein
MNAIEINNLTKIFKGKKGAQVEALQNLSLTIEMGEVFGFLGPNGAGKSTTIKTLMGLLHPSSGTVRIMGIDSSSPQARQRVGFLPENPAFYDYLTADEYLAFVGAGFAMTKAQIVTESERVLRLLELYDARKRLIRSYSKGMVQRLGLAQVLLHDPDLYILDEPMSGLDPVGRALVKEIIVDLKKRGKCVFFSTHITSDVESVCDRVGILIQGVLKSVGRVQTIMTEGVVGYTIRVQGAGGGLSSREVYVPKEELTAFIAAVEQNGETVELIEPRRKDLESFFLDFVKGKTC